MIFCKTLDKVIKKYYHNINRIFINNTEEIHMKRWICNVCGYVHEGDEAPEICPLCGVGAEDFTLDTDE